MEINSIEQLREIRDKLRAAIKEFDTKEFSEDLFGAEHEYDAKGIIAGADAIVTDIAATIRAPKQFLQSSNHEERTNINNKLIQLEKCIKNKDLAGACTSIEALKPILRSFAIRYDDSRLSEFIEHTNELQKHIQSFYEALSEAKKVNKESELACEEISKQRQTAIHFEQELQVTHAELNEKLQEIEKLRESSKSTLNKDISNSEDIKSILDTVRSQAELIESFSEKIATRETQLQDQEIKTQTYNEELKKFTEERNQHLTEAGQLIESAKQALQYKTAEGLSAAFSIQHEEYENPKIIWGWVAGAAAFIIAAITLGFILTTGQEASISIIISRISLIPILIGGAIFCASQYSRQKRIADDYAYKMVLAKSLVGFSEQLSSQEDKGDEYQLYIKSVLSQILTDPQRSRTKKPSNNKNYTSELDLEETLVSLKDIPQELEKLAKLLDKK